MITQERPYFGRLVLIDNGYFRPSALFETSHFEMIELHLPFFNLSRVCKIVAEIAD